MNTHMNMNGRWHKEQHLSRAASLDEKLKWHIMHRMACPCHGHSLPKYVTQEIKKRKIHC